MAADQPFKRSPLMSLDEALGQVLAQVNVISEVESVDTFEADARFLAEDLISELQVPPQDNSAMDGYAVRAEDLQSTGLKLQVTQRIPAGHHGHELKSGEAARIFTGAPIPLGASAVVMQEDVQILETESNAIQTENQQAWVQINALPQPGQWIRRSGEDVRKGDVVLPRGTRLNPASLGLAASIGRAQLSVVRKPRVALFSTGDELVMPGDIAPGKMPPGAIYNSNRFFLRALLLRAGCDVTDLGIVPDNLPDTLRVLSMAAQDHDLVLTSGGVSVGEEDHVKPAVEQLGRLNLWQISMKPGKPFAFGQLNVHDKAQHPSTFFMGLPGNPVSSYITFQLLVRPFLMALHGHRDASPQAYLLQSNFDFSNPDKRREFLRVKRNSEGKLDLFPNQSSGVLTSVVWGDGVIDNPSLKAIQKGDWVRFIPFSDWLQ
jgi:molybdopterin molybdotransferase